MLTGQLALVIAASFAGVALYVSVSEQPARLQLDERAMLMQWKPSYRHGAVMQGSLSLVGTIFGLLAWWQSGSMFWLAGAVSLILPWPFTIFVIKPTNDKLLAIDPQAAGAQSRAMIETWGRLHLVRLAFGVIATVLYLFASLSH